MKHFSKVLLVSLIFLGSFQSAQAASDCGNWDDVSDRDYSEYGSFYNYNDVLTMVCEYGLMEGYSSSDYGFGDELTRTEAATIVNRLYYGSDAYDDLDMDRDAMWAALAHEFDDVPNNSDSNEWMIKAMYYANLNDFMNGDAGKVTFRPRDGINIVETWKIFYEASYASEILSDDADQHISYDQEPWWKDLVNSLEDGNVFTHLDTEAQSFWLLDPILMPYSNFESEMNREDAAIFLASMIEQGFIDTEKLAEHSLGDSGYCIDEEGDLYQDGEDIDYGSYSCMCNDGEVEFCTGENS